MVIIVFISFKFNLLKPHKAKIGLATDVRCSCGADSETTHHYFIECPLYNEIRLAAVAHISLMDWQIKTILHGRPGASKEENKKLCHAAQRFITDSKRFD